MPRKPTIIARNARERIIEMTRETKACLPPVRKLSESLDLHPSTIFRLLRDLAAEGVVWQSFSGRFYPASARKHRVRGLPVYFIGRELWNWSRLYQEILDGVSEVCAANGSPLILLSSPSLVRQADPALPPVFASPKTQKKELAALLPAIARKAGGIILDHLWCEPALSQLELLATPKLQLLHGTRGNIPVASPEIHWAASSTREYLLNEKIDDIDLVIPFRGDKAIDAAVEAIRAALAGLPFREVLFAELNGELQTLLTKPTGRRRCLVCAEDNTASLLLQQIVALGTTGNHITLFGTQGTGQLSAPARRLRVDYRRLGRAAASQLLHGTPVPQIRPALISPQPDYI